MLKLYTNRVHKSCSEKKTYEINEHPWYLYCFWSKVSVRWLLVIPTHDSEAIILDF